MYRARWSAWSHRRCCAFDNNGDPISSLHTYTSAKMIDADNAD